MKKYVKHVRRHLEQLALFALPTLDDGTFLEDIEEDEQTSAQLSLGENSSHDVSDAVSPNLEPLEQVRTLLPRDEEGIAHGPKDDPMIEDQKSAQIRAGEHPETPTSTTEEIEGFQLDRRTESITHDDGNQTDYEDVRARIASIEIRADVQLDRIERELHATEADQARLADLRLWAKRDMLLSTATQVEVEAFHQIDQLKQEVEESGKEISKEMDQALDLIATIRRRIQNMSDSTSDRIKFTIEMKMNSNIGPESLSETEETGKARTIELGESFQTPLKPLGSITSQASGSPSHLKVISENQGGVQSLEGLVRPIEAHSRDADAKVKRETVMETRRHNWAKYGYGKQYNGSSFEFESGNGIGILDISGNTWNDPRVLPWYSTDQEPAIYGSQINEPIVRRKEDM
ncbi:hypothetical protein IL306_013524 [Fusarium sp. DS 682]|nr:hypothetical protein IL306_013524 [Fusarium sp. DS 682]